MARISVSPTMLSAIGKVIGEASMDPSKRASLKTDPAAALRSAGVPDSSLDGLQLEIIEDSGTVVHLVVPFGVDTDKVKANDQEYLELLGTVAVLGCVREDLPAQSVAKTG